MKRTLGGLGLAALITLAMVSPARSGEFGVGGGIYYNRYLNEIKNDDYHFDQDYLSYLLSLKYQFLDWFAIEGMLDYNPGGDDLDYALRPSGTLVLQTPILINAGVGINSTYTVYKQTGGGSTSDWSDMGYHFKAGIQIPLAILWLNLDCYYFLDELKDIEDFDSDLLTFGARAHIRF